MGTFRCAPGITPNSKVQSETVNKELKQLDCHQLAPARPLQEGPGQGLTPKGCGYTSKFDLPSRGANEVPLADKYLAEPRVCQPHGVYKCSHCGKAPWLPRTEPQIDQVFRPRVYG